MSQTRPLSSSAIMSDPFQPAAASEAPQAAYEHSLRQVFNMHIADVKKSVANTIRGEVTEIIAGMTIVTPNNKRPVLQLPSKYQQDDLESLSDGAELDSILDKDLTDTYNKNARHSSPSSNSDLMRGYDPRLVKQCFNLGTDEEKTDTDFDVVDFFSKLDYKQQLRETFSRFRSGELQSSAVCTLVILFLIISKLFDYTYHGAINGLLTLLCAAHVLYSFVQRHGRSTKTKRTSLRHKPGLVAAVVRQAIAPDPRVQRAHNVKDDFKVRKRYEQMGKRANSLSPYTPSELGDENETLARFSSDLSETRPYVQGTLNGIFKTRFLIDSGSSVSTINEVALGELEALYGRKLPRLESSIILKSYGGKDLSVLGIVVADVCIGSASFLTPFVVVQSCSFSPCILGSNVIVRKRLVMNWHGDQMYLHFANSTEKLGRITLMDSTSQPLYAVSTTEAILPGITKTVVVALVSAYRPTVSHNLNNKRGLITKSPDCDLPVEIDGIGQFKKNTMEIAVKNVGDFEISLPQFCTLAGFDLLDPNDLIDLRNPDKFQEENGCTLLAACPCREHNRVLLCSPQGETFMGEHFHPAALTYDNDLEGTIVANKGNLYMIPHSKLGYSKFTEGDFTLALKQVNFNPHRPISVIYAKPELLDKSAQKYLANLMLKQHNLQMRYSAAFSRVDSCTRCKKHRLQFHTGMALKSEEVADIYIFLARNNLTPGVQWFQMHKDSPVSTFTLGGVPFQSYRRTLQQITVVGHMKPNQTQNAMTFALLQLFIQLRDLCPSATLHIAQSTNPTSLTDKGICHATQTRAALDKLRNLKGRTVFNLRQARRKPVVAAEQVEIESKDLPHCTYECCTHSVLSNKQEEIYEGSWPKPSLSPTQLGEYVQTKMGEFGITEDDCHPTAAEIGSLVTHDLNLKFSGPPGMAVAAIDFSGNYTRAVEATYTPATHEVSIDEAAVPFGYENCNIPRLIKLQPENYLDGVNLEGTPEHCVSHVTKIANEFGPTLISYGPDDFRPIKKYSLKLEVKDKDLVYHSKPYPLGPDQMEFMQEQLRNMERLGLISRARDSKFVSAAFLVKKSAQTAMDVVTKGAKPSYRVVIDFIQLNKNLVYNSDPFNVYSCSDLIYRVGSLKGNSNSMLFSCIDIRNFFGALLVHPDSRKYLGIKAYGNPNVWQFNTGPLGLNTSPAVYSELLANALSKETKKHTICHLDDVILASGGDPDDHAKKLRQLLKELDELGVLLSVKKLALFKTSLTYLGNQIDGDGVTLLKSRIDYVSMLPAPTNRKDLAKLLGIFSYCSSYINSYHILASSLYALLSHHKPFELTPFHLKTIRILLHELSNAPSVFHVAQNCPLLMSCDSSSAGTGCVIFQIVLGRPQLIRFWSAKFSAASARSQHSTLFELSGIIRAIESNQYLLSAHPKLIILTDLKALAVCLGNAESHNQGKLARASQKLFSYNLVFTLGWISSESVIIQIPDWLSRIHYKGQERLGYTCYYSHKLESDMKEYKDLALPKAWEEKGFEISVSEFRDFVQDMNKIQPEESAKAAKAAKLKAANKGKHTAPARPTRQVVQTAALSIVTPTLPFNDTPMIDELYHKALPSIEGADTAILMAIEQEEQRADQGKVHLPHAARADPAIVVAVNKPATNRLQDVARLDRDKHVTGDLEGNHIHNMLPFYKITASLVKTDQLSAYDHIRSYFLQRLSQPQGCPIKTKIEKKYIFTADGLIQHFPLRLRPVDGAQPKLVVSTVLALNIMAIIHSIHHGSINQILEQFSKFYYTPRKTYLAEVLWHCCRVCARISVPHRKDAIPGHVVRGTRPGSHLALDFMSMKPVIHNRRSVKTILTVIDTFSMLVLSVIVKDETTSTFLAALDEILTLLPAPVECILSDNQTSLVKHKDVRNYCQQRGIRCTLTTPYCSQGNSPCESSNRVMRRTLQRLQLQYRQSNWAQLFSKAKFIQNSLTRVYAQGKPAQFRMSAIQLCWGIDPDEYLNARASDDPCDIQKVMQTRTFIQKVLDEHHKSQQSELAEKDAAFEVDQQRIKPGALVLLREQPMDKNKAAYRPMVFRVLARRHRNVTLSSLYGKSQVLRAPISTVKKLYYSDLFKLLSPLMQAQLGHNHHSGGSNRSAPSVIQSIDRYIGGKPRQTRAKGKSSLLKARDDSSSDEESDCSMGSDVERDSTNSNSIDTVAANQGSIKQPVRPAPFRPPLVDTPQRGPLGGATPIVFRDTRTYEAPHEEDNWHHDQQQSPGKMWTSWPEDLDTGSRQRVHRQRSSDSSDDAAEFDTPLAATAPRRAAVPDVSPVQSPYRGTPKLGFFSSSPKKSFGSRAKTMARKLFPSGRILEARTMPADMTRANTALRQAVVQRSASPVLQPVMQQRLISPQAFPVQRPEKPQAPTVQRQQSPQAPPVVQQQRHTPIELPARQQLQEQYLSPANVSFRQTPAAPGSQKQTPVEPVKVRTPHLHKTQTVLIARPPPLPEKSPRNQTPTGFSPTLSPLQEQTLQEDVWDQTKVYNTVFPAAFKFNVKYDSPPTIQRKFKTFLEQQGQSPAALDRFDDRRAPIAARKKPAPPVDASSFAGTWDPPAAKVQRPKRATKAPAKLKDYVVDVNGRRVSRQDAADAAFKTKTLAALKGRKIAVSAVSAAKAAADQRKQREQVEIMFNKDLNISSQGETNNRRQTFVRN